MAAYDSALWHELCVALAGASGALLGLAFVAISFNLDAIIADKFLPVETLIFFAYPLAGCLLVLTLACLTRLSALASPSSPPACSGSC